MSICDDYYYDNYTGGNTANDYCDDHINDNYYDDSYNGGYTSSDICDDHINDNYYDDGYNGGYSNGGYNNDYICDYHMYDRFVTTDPTIEMPYSDVNEGTFADPVDVFTGAHLLTYTHMNLFGGQKLKLVANYNSSKLVKGTMGIGWHHNYEKRLEVVDCEARVYSGPSVFSRYVASYFDEPYYCTSPHKKGYVLSVDFTQENPYVIDCNSKYREYYNADGLLAKIVNHQGFETTITYASNLITITDCITNKSIYLEKDTSGKVVKVYDDASRQCLLTYENDMLTNICDVNGNSLSYTYTDEGQVLTGTDAEGVCYFTNTYDEYDRVSTQKDGIEGSIESTFSYGESGERTTSNRNGDISVRVFNKDGLLESYTDENGNTKTYEYDERYNIIKETDNNGNSIIKTYNKFNKPTSITDKNGNVTKLIYNDFGDVVRIEHPQINGITPIETFTYNSRNQLSVYTDLRGTVTEYFYDELGLLSSKKTGGRIVETVFVNGLLMSKKDANGNIETYGYNDIGQQTTKIDAENNTFTYEYDNLGNLLKTTNSNGDVIETRYDSNYQKEYVIDANGNTTQYSYNGNMKNTLVTLPDGNTIEYRYDGEDRPIKIIDQAENETDIAYDKVGNVLSKTFADGSVVSYTHDKVGNVLTETNPKGAVTTKTYDAKGNVLTITDSDGNITRFDYDATRVVRKTNALSGSTVYKYSPAGDLLSEIDAMGNKKSYTHDAYGNIRTFTDAKGNVTSYTYDNNNNVLTICDALGNITVNTYDGNNKLVQTTDAKGNVKKYAYDCQGRCTHITDAKNNVFETVYDANGNILKVIDAKGKTITEKTYNSLNLPHVVKDSTGTTTHLYNALGKVETITDQYNNTRTFSYNSRGLNSSVRDALNNDSSADYDFLGNLTDLTGPLGGTTHFEYDNMGRLVSETTPTGGTVTYGYNELNVKDYIQNAKGQIRKCYYDALGRITGYICEEDTVSYTYDANGNVKTISDKNGTVEREFDALNRVTKYTDTFGRTIGYEYDVVGNLKRLIYPDNTAVEYEYDVNNNLVTVTDWANNVTTYVYDENNKVTKTIKPDGSITNVGYDDFQRVHWVDARSSLGAIITSFEYTYDALGRIATEVNLENDDFIWYNYDNLNRMTGRSTAIGGGGQSHENYSYDAAGNITSTHDSVYEYDNQNNVLTGFNNQDAVSDADGNLTSVCINGSTESKFEYDSANRLIKAGGNEYTYNAENLRIKNRCGNTEITYTHNTNCRLSQLLYTEDNGVITKYVYGKGLISDEMDGNARVYHFDYRGSTVAITSRCGSEMVKIKYDAYGNILNSFHFPNVLFCYNGQYGVITDSNGLLYMRARYYSPKLRRFINADILHGEIADSTSLNRYSYVNGNPVSFVDPLGLAAEERGVDKTSTNYYQAILVTDFSLPVVGHAEIYFLSTDGYIYWTEYNATNNSDKLNDINNFAIIGKRFSNSIDLEKELKGKNYVVLNGDFNQSQKLAEEYYNDQKMGRYNFLFNNCSDYTDALLDVADVDGMFTQIQIGGDFLISIPVVGTFITSFATGMDSITNGISDGFCSFGEYVGNYWNWGGSALTNIGEFIDTSSNWIGDSVGGFLQNVDDAMDFIDKAINDGANKLWDWGTSAYNFIKSIF